MVNPANLGSQLYETLAKVGDVDVFLDFFVADLLQETIYRTDLRFKLSVLSFKSK